MLSNLSIRNFRCFQNVNVELKPVTVLIGENNSGKSSFLSAIESLQLSYKQTSEDHFRFDQSLILEVTGTDANGTAFTNMRHKNANKRGQTLESIESFRLPSSGARCSCQGLESGQTLPLLSDGGNLAGVLDFMLRKDRKRYLELEEVLRNLIPGFEELNIDTPQSQVRRIRIKLDGGLEMHGDSMSTGVRHLIFFATLAFHPKAPKIILIEEPEAGVHPRRLGEIMRLLQSISQGLHCNEPAQVILSTHSPFLLDYVDLEKDQVLTFHRQRNSFGDRIVKPVDSEGLKVFLDEFKLGEVWFNESEEGLVKKDKQ